jgi:hypothetical protein
VNGTLEASENRAMESESAGFLIGILKDLASGHFDGSIDEVRFWNFARNQLQIQAAKDLEINATYPGLIAFYNFNEGIACCDNNGLTTLPDGMGANDGTLNGFSLVSGCSSNWVAGAPALGDPLTLTNDVTSDCGSASGTYPVGTTTVTWTATGANGQVATCEQTVTVLDPDNFCTPPASITIIDPCSCKDNATTLADGQFQETIQVNGPAGDTWTVVSAPGLYLTASPAPPAAPLPVASGTPLPESPAGVYTLTGVHVDAQGYSIEVTNGTTNLSISNTCYYPNPGLSGLSALYCSQDGPQAVAVMADLGDVSGTATVENILFELIRQSDNTVIGSQSGLSDTFNFDPSTLPQGQYILRATFDAAYDAAIHPGCVQEVEEEFEVRKVGCGSFPWGGN